MAGIITAEPVKISADLQAKYDKLFQDGILVNVHISVWGMGARLSKEDLGVEADIPKLFKLGKKMLIDPEHLNEFKNLESKARRYLYRNSYDFPISDAHFVPKKRYSEVVSQLDKFKTEFGTLVDTFVANYPTYKDEVLKAYPKIADALRPLYPDVSDIRTKFGFSMASFELSMPRALSDVDIQKLIARDEAKDEVKAKLEAQLKTQHENSVRQLEKFTEDAATTLRTNLVRMCKMITDKIEKKELISKANINTIIAEIDNFRALNFLDDTVVAAEIDRLEEFVTKKHDFKTNKDAIAELENSLMGVLSVAATTTDVSSIRGKYFRKITI